jgi:hypothetical protein
MAVIPIHNTPALVGYYLGVASLIPVIGFATALPAVVCGIFGLIKSIKNPAAAGKGHAISAIVMGTLAPPLWVALFFIVAM